MVLFPNVLRCPITSIVPTLITSKIDEILCYFGHIKLEVKIHDVLRGQITFSPKLTT